MLPNYKQCVARGLCSSGSGTGICRLGERGPWLFGIIMVLATSLYAALTRRGSLGFNLHELGRFARRTDLFSNELPYPSSPLNPIFRQRRSRTRKYRLRARARARAGPLRGAATPVLHPRATAGTGSRSRLRSPYGNSGAIMVCRAR